MSFYTGSITLSAKLNCGTAEPAVVAPKPAAADAPADELPFTDPAQRRPRRGSAPLRKAIPLDCH